MATAEHIQKFRESLVSPNFAYTRARSWRLSGYVETQSDYVVYSYKWDPKSPTGVVLEASMNWDEAIPIMDELGVPFPLSPTEGLRKR